MATDNMGLTEVPDDVEPDVPYWVNTALREVDGILFDQQAAVTAAQGSATSAGAAAAAATATANSANTTAGAAASAAAAANVTAGTANTTATNASSTAGAANTSANSALAKAVAMEGRELPNRGRATILTHPSGADSMTLFGSYQIWTAGDATALGLMGAGEVKVFGYGNIITQINIVSYAAGPISYFRQSVAGVWGTFKAPRNVDYETRLGALEVTSSAAKKRVGIPLTLAGSAAVVDTRTAVGHFVPFRALANVSSFTVNVRNYNDRGNVVFPGALSLTGIYIGKAALDSFGRPTGAFAGAPTQIVGAVTTDAGGAAYVSPTCNYALTKGTAYLLSYGYTCAAQNNHSAVGGGFTNTDPASIGNVTPSVTKTQVSPLDIWLNAEVLATTPHNAYFGDSLTAGVSSDLPVYDSWANRHAAASGAVATIYAHSGTAHSDWTSGVLPKFTKYNAMAKPDLLYWSMGSNDIFAGITIETMRARFAVTHPLITAVTTPRIVLTTILPRLDGSAAAEAVRKDWNNILRDELPGDALMCLDPAAAVTAPDGSTLDARWRATVADIHMSRQGYARFAGAVLGTV